jgi:succinate dehydrogenase/fumarate reductase flavoprotein subunit
MAIQIVGHPRSVPHRRRRRRQGRARETPGTHRTSPRNAWCWRPAIPGLHAAGELVGGLFYFNYPGGTGLMNGAVFGKIAKTSAGQRAAQMP